MKYVICYSGGQSSSECALSVAKKYGAENVILLNHDINPKIEQSCTKKLKSDVAEYLGLEVTYANHKDWSTATPVSVCVDAGAWKVGNGQILCTNRLKTEPFMRWMKENDPNQENVYVYGMDPDEPARIDRRAQIMGSMGYKTLFPMLWGESEIVRLSDVGIEHRKGFAQDRDRLMGHAIIKPDWEGIYKELTHSDDMVSIYEVFNHSNCMGCLKAGWQHWYIIYCLFPHIWDEAKYGEDEIGYAIHKDRDGPVYLEDKEDMFAKMKAAGVVPTEKVPFQRFWADAKKAVKEYEFEMSQMEIFDEGVCLECTV